MADRRQVIQGAVLAVAGLALLPACSAGEPEPPPAPTPDPQQADELALIAAYDAAAAAAGPDDRAVLQRIRDEHAAHLTALGWTEQPTTAAPLGGITDAQLARAERRAARVRSRAARQAPDPAAAQLLALIAASEAQHAAWWEAR
jgi:hypothetical protein